MDLTPRAVYLWRRGRVRVKPWMCCIGSERNRLLVSRRRVLTFCWTRKQSPGERSTFCEVTREEIHLAVYMVGVRGRSAKQGQQANTVLRSPGFVDVISKPDFIICLAHNLASGGAQHPGRQDSTSQLSWRLSLVMVPPNEDCDRKATALPLRAFSWSILHWTMTYNRILVILEP